MYIIVTDATGLEIGYDTGNFQPAIHRVLVEDNRLYGVENIYWRFRDSNGKLNEQEWMMFVQLMCTLPSGVYRELSWQREG